MTPNPARRSAFVVLCLLVAGGLSRAAVPDTSGPAGAVIKAGIARVEITPDRPLALEGYEHPEHRISEGVHDRLYARALALVGKDARLVLVSADLASFMFGPYLQRQIAERAGLQPDEILLCAIHTHSGPQLSLNPEYPHPENARYTSVLTDRLVAAVKQALHAVEPVTMRVGHSRSLVGVSRRIVLPGGRVEMMPNPEGVSDPDVLALRLERKNGTLLGVLFSYACHSRSLRGANRLISGDVLGIAEQHAEARLGGAFVAAFAGASADVDPARVMDGFAAPAGDVPDTVRLGESLGDAVVDAATSATMASPVFPFRMSVADVPLPGKHGAARSVRVAAGAIGDVGLVAVECEVSVEVGLAVKAASPFRHTFVATVCHAWGGYLPATRQYPEGGYEVTHSPYAAGAVDELVRAAVGMLQRLRSGR